MTLFEHVKKYLKKDSKTAQVQTPEGYCPNCWGRQEYSGTLYQVLKAENIDSNNVDQRKGWIQGYAEKHLIGIRLNKVENKLVCDVCYTTSDINE